MPIFIPRAHAALLRACGHGLRSVPPPRCQHPMRRANAPIPTPGKSASAVSKG